MSTTYSDAQVLCAISAALEARDMPAVVGLLHVLAAQAPGEAAIIYDSIMLLTRNQVADRG